MIQALALLVFGVLGAASSALACVVGTGTSASCTAAALDSCIFSDSPSFDGTVTFNCGGAATITVTPPIDINADTNIDGGSLITISAGGKGPVLFFMNAPFSVENLTIADVGGNEGAIFRPSTIAAPLTVSHCTFSGNSVAIDSVSSNSSATVTVTDSTFDHNTTVAIAGSGTVTVSNSVFIANGGGISGGAMVTVTDSTFAGNSAVSSGGAINSNASLTVANCTFSGNSAAGNGGAMLIGGPTTVSNSTFVGNSAGSNFAGGAIDAVSSNGLTVINSTFSGNAAGTGGAIRAATPFVGLATVVNSILAGSTSGGNCSGTITDDGHNIDDGTTCRFTGTGCAMTTGTSFCNTNPQLGPLADNGGPTQTMALEAGSPAINAGDETVCAAPPVENLDQRGFVRPGMGATNCSIGAYEFNAIPPTTTTTATTSTTTTTSSSTSTSTTTSTTTSSTTSTTQPTTTTTSTTTSTTSTTHATTMTTSTTTTTITSTTTTIPVVRCGDVNGDGVVNIGDALLVAQFDAGSAGRCRSVTPRRAT